MGTAALYCSDERITDDKETTEIRSQKRSQDRGTKRRSNSSRKRSSRKKTSGCSLFKGSHPPEDNKGRPVLDMITTTPMDSELESGSRSSDSLDPFEYRKVSVEYTCAPEGEPPKRKRVVNVLASPKSSPKTSRKPDRVPISPKASGRSDAQKTQIKTILRNLRVNTSESESANFESYEEKRKESDCVEFEDSSSLASSSTEVIPSGPNSRHPSGQVVTPGYRTGPSSSGSDCSGRKNDEMRDDDCVDDTTPDHGYESDAESRTATAAGDENPSTDDGRKSSSAGSEAEAMIKSPVLRFPEAEYGSPVQTPDIVPENPYLLTGPVESDAESYDQAIWSTMKGRSKAKFVMNPNWDESLMMTRERRLSCDDDNRSISRLSIWSGQQAGEQPGTGLCDDNNSVRSGMT